MPIIGDRPESGIRVVLERRGRDPREPADSPPWRYEGTVQTPDGETPLRATIEADGVVRVEGPAPELAEKVRLILRTAYKQTKHDDGRGPQAPPRKIVRWRGEK